MVRINRYTVKLVKENGGLYDLEDKVINNPYNASKLIQTVLDLHNSTVEKFGILTLDTKSNVIGVHIISIGNLNSSIVHPREVFQQAILNNACGILLFHNHPSGDTTPSPQDIDVTNKLVKAGELLAINVVDHIIVGDVNHYTSFKENSLM
jgi:DNA repair protein RadC